MSVVDASHSTLDFPNMLKKWRKMKRVSQLDFSLDAGISQKHLSFLESGRSKPSRDMVLTISEALDLSLRDKNHLLHAAGFAHVFNQRPLESQEMQAVQDALQMTLKHHEPYPALVADRNWDLLMANDAALRWIALLGNPEELWQKVDPSGRKNVYRMTLSEFGMRPFIANWDVLAHHLMKRLQREMANDPDNEVLIELYNDLMSMTQIDEASIELDYEDAFPPILATCFKLGQIELNVFSMISSFGTALDVTADEIRVETFFPADEFTKNFFESLARQS